MSFIIRNLTVGAISIDDLGIQLAASADLDISFIAPQDVAISADLVASIAAGDIAVLSPLDGVTVLNIADSTEVVEAHNDPHWGIRAGTLNQLDDVDTTGQANGDVLQLSGGSYSPVTPSTLAGSINLGDLNDVDDGTAHTLNTVYVFKGDGTNLDVVDFTSDPDVTENIQDIVGAMGVNGTDTTFAYNDGAGTIQWNVNDVFLRNTGDVLDSGTLTIASGASIAVATGADLTIADAPVNPTDAANKEYVDSVAAGLDPKESVRVATTADLGATYNAAGGTGGTGAFTSAPTSIDGVALADGDRVLVKNQGDAQQNGIYVVVTAATGAWERAPDHDGSPSNEVSGGNFTFVEQGTVNENTGWVLQGDGILTLNTDDLNWVQFSESTVLNAGLGLSQGGNDFDLDVDDLVVATITGADSLAFHDVDGAAAGSGSGAQTYKTTVTNFLADLNIITGGTQGGNITASDGVLITAANDIQLDITNLSDVAVTAADEMVFDDGASGTHIKRTAQNFMNDLDIVHNLGGNGIAVQTGADTYTARSIAVDGAGALDGLAVTNGDGVAGNPTVGLDIQNLPARTDAVDNTDRVAVYNITSGANEYYTVAELAGAAGASDSFVTWAGAGNTTGDGSIVAESSADTATLTGGIGINIDLTAATDTVVYSFTQAGMADTAVVGADTIPFFDASNSNEPEFRSLTNVISDLGLATAAFTTIAGDTGTAVADTASDTLNLIGATNGGITTVATDDPENVTFGITGNDLAVFGATLTTADFVMINDATDTASTLSTRITWANVISDLNITTGGVTSVTASALEDELGIVIGGAAATPTVGIDIVGLTDPDGDLAATDEFIVHDKSEGTGGANRKMTGQNISDGVLAIAGLAITTIGGQNFLTLVDSTRANKILSVDSTQYMWSENRITNNGWLDIGNAVDATSGYILPFNATVVGATWHTSDDNNNNQSIDLYVDGVNTATILTLTAVNGENEEASTTLNIDVNANQKLRLRGGTGGNVEDSVIVLHIKWRG